MGLLFWMPELSFSDKLRPLEMTKNLPVHVIYASTSGNVEAVVEKVATILEHQGYTALLYRSEQTSIDVIEENQQFVIATSTWEHGAINPFFVKLHDQMKQADIKGKRAAFIGLGDRRYEPVLFCEGMEKVRRTWLKNGGSELQEPLKINGEPYGLLETTVLPWASKLVQALTSQSQPSMFQSIKKWLSHD